MRLELIRNDCVCVFWGHYTSIVCNDDIYGKLPMTIFFSLQPTQPWCDVLSVGIRQKNHSRDNRCELLLLPTLTVALFSSSVPVSHDSATVWQKPGTEKRHDLIQPLFIFLFTPVLFLLWHNVSPVKHACILVRSKSQERVEALLYETKTMAKSKQFLFKLWSPSSWSNYEKV